MNSQSVSVLHCSILLSNTPHIRSKAYTKRHGQGWPSRIIVQHKAPGKKYIHTNIMGKEIRGQKWI